MKVLDEVKIFWLILIFDDLFYYGFSIRIGGFFYIFGMKFLNVFYMMVKWDLLVLIEENRCCFVFKVGFDVEIFYIVKVVYGNMVYEIGIDFFDGGYDGVISNKLNVICVVFGVDCVIIFFVDLI